MYRLILVSVVSVISAISGFSQDSLLVGKKYKEDQIYLSYTYNVVTNRPKEVIQKGLPIGIHTGFIKDISLNESGKLALGIGIGYAYDKYQLNFIMNDQGEPFEITTADYKKNKFETHAVELPIEIRIRNSSDVNYKFWRLYVGGKISYIFSSKYIYKLDTDKLKIQPVPYLNKWQYGPMVSIGYNTWNLNAYWNLNPVFKDAPSSDNFDPNELKSLHIGLQFYIF